MKSDSPFLTPYDQERDIPAKVTATVSNEDQKVADWRTAQFLLLNPQLEGEELTRLVASDIELRRVEQLLNAGCPWTLAIDIES